MRSCSGSGRRITRKEFWFRIFVLSSCGAFDLSGVGCVFDLVLVQEEALTERKGRNSMVEDKGVASSSKSSDNNTQVELQIRCSGYPTIKGTFSAGIYVKSDTVECDHATRVRGFKKP